MNDVLAPRLPSLGLKIKGKVNCHSVKKACWIVEEMAMVLMRRRAVAVSEMTA